VQNRPELGLIFKAKTRIINFFKNETIVVQFLISKGTFNLGVFIYFNGTFGLVLKSFLWIESP
jgi:hypothetical protein